MKISTIIAFGIAAGAVIAIGSYQLGTRHSGAMPARDGMSTPAMPDAKLDPKTGRPVLYWHDPMVPATKFDKPGKSPFMDMQLVPVYADEAAGTGVSVAPGVAQNLGIRTAIVRKVDMSSRLEVVGVIAQNERGIEVVQSRVSGYVEKLQVRAALDPVRKGQALATIYAPEWASALEEYLGIRKAQAGSSLVDAARARLRLLYIPDDVVARSEQSGMAQTRFTLTAPTSGVVAELGVRDGAMVTPGMTLFRIADLSTVWAMADVPEAVVSQIRIGSDADVLVTGLPDPIAGKLSAILPDVDPATRTLKARIELRNPGLVLKPGMFVRVTFKQASSMQALVIPQEAVIATGKRNIVIVAVADGKYASVEVQLGRENGPDVEVKSGLSEGQKVVASGQFLLDSEASLKSWLSRLDSGAPGMTTPQMHTGSGKVVAIDKDEVTISHGPIASIQWGAMTMGFKAPKNGLPKDLKPDSQVTFAFSQQGDAYQLERITPAMAGARP
jgi:Cu(I)/Ag(I) efflux system membrane fusion protein